MTWLWMETTAQDLRIGARSLRRNPGVTAVALLSLGLAIGANTAIFSVVNAMLLRSLPYRDAGRLAMLWTSNSLNGSMEQNTSPPNVRDWQARSRAFEDMAAYREADGPISSGESAAADVEWRSYAWVTGNFFKLLGRAPALGRAFGDEAIARREPVVVVSHRLWQQRFQGSTAALGRSLDVNGTSLVVIGVMPQDFWFPSKEIDLWVPGSLSSLWAKSHEDRSRRFGAVVGRLAAGATLQQASVEMHAIGAQLAREYPDANDRLGVNVVPLHVQVNGKTVPFMLAILLGAVTFVLLIACANVANLLLARGVGRGREFAVRAALGASSGRLARQLLTESLLLACLAGTCGLLLAVWIVRGIAVLAPRGIARLDEVRVDGSALLFTLALSLACGILFGMVPMLQISRGAAGGSLHATDRSASTPRPIRVARRWFVVTQFALALVLLSGAGLLIRSLIAVQSVDSGFADTSVLTAHLRFDSRLSKAQRVELYREAMVRIEHVPGVRAAGAAGTMFWPGTDANFGVRAVDGRPPEPREHWTPLTWTTIGGDYFQALGVPLLRGRFFSDRDRPDSPPVVLINEAMARRYWPGQDAVGQRIKGFDPRGQHDDWVTVVGVVGDVHSRGLERTPMAQIFECQSQSLDSTESLVVSLVGGGTAEAVQQTIRGLDRTAVLSDVSTLAQVIGEQGAQRRFQTLLLGSFAALALLLAGAGIFAAMHYAVAQRTRELGIRLALGAQRANILHLVMREGMTLAMVGVGLGLAGSLIVTRTIASLLFGVTAQDPATFVAVSLVLTATAAVGCLLPARRATRIDAMIALRAE